HRRSGVLTMVLTPHGNVLIRFRVVLPARSAKIQACNRVNPAFLERAKQLQAGHAAAPDPSSIFYPPFSAARARRYRLCVALLPPPRPAITLSNPSPSPPFI